MLARYDVMVLGRYYCDLVFTGLPEMPRLGAEIFGTDFDIVPGGTYTTALALARLKMHAAWPCDFGNDFFSQFVLDSARHEGLDSTLFHMHNKPVRRVTAALSFPHDRGFVSYVDDLETVQPVELIRQHRPRSVLLSGLGYGVHHHEIVDAARDVGALVYMDCQSVSSTIETVGVREALQSVDIFAPNEAEAQLLTHTSTVEAALDKLSALVPLTIVKRGGAGAVARRGTETFAAPSLPVTVFDTTGAGDCFNAGFLYGLLRDRPLEECLRCGNIVGGLSTTARGGAACPSAAQVEEWLQVGFRP